MKGHLEAPTSTFLSLVLLGVCFSPILNLKFFKLKKIKTYRKVEGIVYNKFAGFVLKFLLKQGSMSNHLKAAYTQNDETNLIYGIIKTGYKRQVCKFI